MDHNIISKPIKDHIGYTLFKFERVPYPILILLFLCLHMSLIAKDITSYGDTDYLKDEICSAEVLFPKGNPNVIGDFMNNEATLEALLEQLVLLNKNDKISQIIITGYASPEGKGSFNQRLSNQRALNLYSFLRDRIGLPEQVFKINSEGINWIGLYKAMEDCQLEDAKRVQAIIEGETQLTKPNLKTSSDLLLRLRNLENGRTWSWLLDSVFPELRSCTVTVVSNPDNSLSTDSEVSVDEQGMTLYNSAYVEDTSVALEVQSPQKISESDSGETVSELISENLVFEACDPNDVGQLSQICRYPALTIGSNVLYDIFYMPNYGWAPMPDVQIQYFLPRLPVSLIGEFTFPYWEKPSQHKYFKIHNFHVEGRYYFKSLSWNTEEDYAASYTGWYAGAYGNSNRYTIGFNADKGWEGQGWGAGVTTGYVLNLSANGRWKLDLNLSFGFYKTHFDPYSYGDDNRYYYDYEGEPILFKKLDHKRWWMGPTNIGLTVSYTIFYKRSTHTGLGLKRKEVVK